MAIYGKYDPEKGHHDLILADECPEGYGPLTRKPEVSVATMLIKMYPRHAVRTDNSWNYGRSRNFWVVSKDNPDYFPVVITVHREHYASS